MEGFITTEKVVAIQPPRFVSPRQRAYYDDDESMALFRKAFGSILPIIRKIDENVVNYYGDSNGESEAISLAVPVDQEGVSEYFAPLLLGGFRRLRELAAHESVSEGVRALAMNFKLPDPRKSPENFLIYRDELQQEQVFILWGYERADAPAIHVSKVLHYFYPESSLEELLEEKTQEDAPKKVSARYALPLTASVALLAIALAIAIWPEKEVGAIESNATQSAELFLESHLSDKEPTDSLSVLVDDGSEDKAVSLSNRHSSDVSAQRMILSMKGDSRGVASQFNLPKREIISLKSMVQTF